jgi:phosphoribosylformimino-5-aminoimidazole carboxamide ribotide isomerase
VILGIDAREGKVAVEGWTEATGDVLDVARQYEGWTCALVYTDIAVTG